MKKAALLILVTLPALLLSCIENKPLEEPVGSPEPVVEKQAPKTIISVSIPDFTFSLSDLTINKHLDSMDLRAFTHFGEFYTEDFTIYRLDRIDFLAEAYFIDDINLFFIDSVLVKIQAFLREDRSNEFMRSYGKASISINDYHNKKLLEQEDLLVKVDGRTRINQKLDNFTLRWDREELDISYHVNKKNDSTQVENKTRLKSLGEDNYRYKLNFQAKDFDNQLAWIKWEGYKQARGLEYSEDIN